MGATTNGLPWPEGTDRVADGDDAIRALAEAVDAKALFSGNTGNLNPLTAGFTAKPGFVLNGGVVIRRNGVVSVQLDVKSLNPIGAGNITNIACIGIPAGWIPKTRAPLSTLTAGPGLFYYADYNGTIIIGATVSAIPANYAITIGGLWLV